MYVTKEFRDKILTVLDENDGDIHLQADGLIALLKEEGLVEEDSDLEAFEDSEEEESQW